MPVAEDSNLAVINPNTIIVVQRDSITTPDILGVEVL
jgi:hypothetical protein